jgi:hypothetical protein
MKLYLVILGLFAIATPDAQDGPVEVLFLSGGPHAAMTGLGVPRHFLHLQHYVSGDEGPVLLDTTWEAPLNLRIGGNGPVALVNPEGFVDLSTIVVPNEPLHLRAECAGDAAVRNCLVDGHPALSARLVLGGGRLLPAEILLAEVFRAPAIPQAQDTWTFRPLGARPAENDPRRTTFNGALFELDLPAGAEELALKIGDSQLALRPQKLAQCSTLSQSASSDECIIVRLDNSVGRTGIDTAIDILKVINLSTSDILSVINRQFGTTLQLGSTVKIASQHNVDTHFQLIYPLLSNNLSRERQVVPHIDRIRGREEPPESRCIPPVVKLPTEGDGI